MNISLGEEQQQKKEILPLATTRKDVDSIMLSAISRAEKDNYCMISIYCMWNLKKTNELGETEN